MGLKRVFRRCKHSTLVDTSGSYTVVAARIRAAETSRCPECEAERALGHEVPRFVPLWDEEGRAVEADHIRRRVLRQACVLVVHAPQDELPLYDRLIERIRSLGDVEWWLDHRDDALVYLAHDPARTVLRVRGSAGL